MTPRYEIGGYVCKMSAHHAEQWNDGFIDRHTMQGAKICVDGKWVDLWTAIEDDDGEDTALYTDSLCGMPANLIS